jgi:two-component system CheB/CheR fusion protein
MKSSKPAARRKTAVESPPEKSSLKGKHSMFIAGIGASAGGLEALEQFLRQVPAETGIAFVIVQHLDPTHKGMMPELLQRSTRLKVRQVQDRMQVQPDCVYVIPPNKTMSILHGVLHLFEPAEPRGLRLPIDFFFLSLAEDQQERSIGIILSGMGSDGTAGLRAIKSHSGLVAVQEPGSAKFDSMPRSAIDAGLADLVASAEELPARILTLLRNTPLLVKPGVILAEREKSALEKIIILLRSRTGQDFSLYKKTTLYRRIERRMGIHQLDRIADYVRLLQNNPQEVEILFKELLIGVTSFFRDPQEWELLGGEGWPALLTALPEGGSIRAWSAGCSSGEEAYSLAISFQEALERQKPAHRCTLQVFATDLDQDAIDRARHGIYPANIAADVSAERLKRFFVREENGYRVGREIREMVTFATQNLILDPPFTKLDLLLCRNLLIYLEAELQKKLVPLFHYSLNPGGFLFLGNSESVGGFSDGFTPIQSKSRLFRRRELALRAEVVSFPAMPHAIPPGNQKESTMPKPVANLQSLAEQLLLRDHSPPAVLASEQGDILYISGRTGKYLEPAAGKANWNLFAMARDGLRFELTSAFQKAVRQQETLTVKGAKVASNGGEQAVELTVQPIKSPEALQGMVLVVFQDVALPPRAKTSGRGQSKAPASARVTELEQELSRCREELQATREGMQTSQEELKSMNEELQSTNEELQSTNEELTTSKEEMQSMNEELQTVNAEQLAKMDELGRVNSDMKNLLNSTEIITIFLDNDLRVQRFTSGAVKIFKLIPGDVGRPLSDIVTHLRYPELADDARAVQQTLAFSEKQVPASDGSWFVVRIMPYRTMEDRIDGIVLTFTDITAAKALESELRQTGEMLRILLQTVPSLVICLDEEGRILEFNPSAERLLGRPRSEVLGQSYVELFVPEADRKQVAKNLKSLLDAPANQTFLSQVTTPDGQSLTIQWTTRPIPDADGKLGKIVNIGKIITE